MSKLAGQVAIVTEGSKGIGAAIAKCLSQQGASVVVNYVSSKNDADRVVDGITSQGGKAIAVQGNIANAADVQRLFAETHTAFGRLDILVNNAGVYEFAPIEEFTAEHFHRLFNTNVLGLLLASREAVQYFGDKGGSIINIGSSVTSTNPHGSHLHRFQEFRRCHHTGPLQRAWPQEDSRQLHQSWPH